MSLQLSKKEKGMIYLSSAVVTYGLYESFDINNIYDRIKSGLENFKNTLELPDFSFTPDPDIGITTIGGSYAIISYATEWDFWNQKNRSTPSAIPTNAPMDYITELNYAFQWLQCSEAQFDLMASHTQFVPKNKDGTSKKGDFIEGTIDVHDGAIWEGAPEWNPPDNPPSFKEEFETLIANYPRKKFGIALGGWTLGFNLVTIFSDRDKRQIAVESIRKRLEDSHYTTFDIDWEWPVKQNPLAYYDTASTDDADKYRAFVDALYEEFEKASYKIDITCTIGASEEALSGLLLIDTDKIKYINLMTYDYFAGGFSDGAIGNMSGLFNNPNDTRNDSTSNCDWAVKYLLDKGIPSRKICIGVAGYGRSFKNCVLDNEPTGYEAELFGTCTPGTQGVVIDELVNDGQGLSYYKDIVAGIEDGTFEEHYDTASGQAWVINADNSIIAFDNLDSVTAKAQYVIDHKLGGVIVWLAFSDADGDKSLFKKLHEIFSTSETIIEPIDPTDPYNPPINPPTPPPAEDDTEKTATYTVGATLWEDHWDEGSLRTYDGAQQTDSPIDPVSVFRGTGSMTIDGAGILTMEGSQPRHYVYIDVKSAEFEVEFYEDSFGTQSYSGGTLGMRSDTEGHSNQGDHAHTYYFRIRKDQKAQILAEPFHGTYDTLDIVDFAWTEKTWYKLKIIVYNIGDDYVKIEGYVNDVLICVGQSRNTDMVLEVGNPIIRNTGIAIETPSQYKNGIVREIINIVETTPDPTDPDPTEPDPEEPPPDDEETVTNPVPSAPLNFSWEDRGPSDSDPTKNSIKLIWEAPQYTDALNQTNTPNISNYRITSGQTDLIRDAGTDTYKFLGGLNPAIIYDFTIIAKNDSYDGYGSSTKIFVDFANPPTPPTDPEDPAPDYSNAPSEPLNVQWEDRGMTSSDPTKHTIRIWWENPQYSNTTTQDTGISAEFLVTNDQGSTPIQTNLYEVFKGGLDVNTTYDYHIQAKNDQYANWGLPADFTVTFI